MRYFLILSCVFSCVVADSAYRLQGFDAEYNLLNDAPIIQKGKALKSHNAQNRTPRPPKKQSNKRIEPPKSSTRAVNARDFDGSRLSILENEPARIRYGFPPYPPQHFLMIGLNGGADIFSAESSADSAKKLIGVEIMGKFGYLYFFTRDANSHALRIYAHFGTAIPTNKALAWNVAFGGNIDFLINVFYFDLFLGVGYGGEYFTSGLLKHGTLLNTGISRRIGNHQIELGVRVPFYFLPDSAILRHNIDILLGWNYRF
ncbi:hypothetical protein ACWIUD_00655 [Helicobacter sp. 23-1044]